MKTFFLIFVLFITIKGQTQNNSRDTSFFYAILLVERSTVKKDLENSITFGDYFDSMYVVNDRDTFNVKYNYPFLIVRRDMFSKLKRLSDSINNMKLYMSISRSKDKSLIEMPFNIAFDHYIVILSHPRKKSKFYYCYFSSVSYKFNTSNKGYGIANELHKK